MTQDGHTPKTPMLSEVDAAALDALVEAGFRVDDVPAALAERAAHVAAMLGLLDTPLPGTSEHRVNDVMARVALESNPEQRLDAMSDAATESYVMAGFSASRVPSALVDRARVLERFAERVTALPPKTEASIAAGREARIERVMGAVRATDRSLDPIGYVGRPRVGFRLPDLVAAAAVLLIASAIMFPTLGALRHGQMQSACLVNGQRMAEAFGLYATDYRSSLPMASAGFGGSWMQVGTSPDRSNSANLFTMVRTGYAGLGDMACPGNEQAPTRLVTPDMHDWQSLEEVSYSYRIMLPSSAAMHALPGDAVLVADRSPIILRVARGEAVSPEARSPNHGWEGQHVLRLNGTVEWVKDPVLDGDNIWLPRPIERAIHSARAQIGLVQGNELPESSDDAFLGP
jgi:hypothetical protein